MEEGVKGTHSRSELTITLSKVSKLQAFCYAEYHLRPPPRSALWSAQEEGLRAEKGKTNHII
jgi:hypothetical protein